MGGGRTGKSENFLDRWQELEWDDIGMQIRAKSAAGMWREPPERTASHPERFYGADLAGCRGILPQMAAEAERLTRQRFGNTIGFYVPLYLSNRAPTTAPTAASP